METLPLSACRSTVKMTKQIERHWSMSAICMAKLCFASWPDQPPKTKECPQLRPISPDSSTVARSKRRGLALDIAQQVAISTSLTVQDSLLADGAM